MAFVHGKGLAVSIDGNDLSIYGNNFEFERNAETHETTTYGKNSKVYQSGLKDGTASLEGFYDNTVDVSPGGVFRPLIGGVAVPLVYEPEGTGTGKPISTVDVIVQTYTESSPVNDMVTFSAELQFSDDIADTVGV